MREGYTMAGKGKGYVCLESHVAKWKGNNRFFTAGTFYEDLKATDVKGREHLFKRPDDFVETATAAPGEVRKAPPRPKG
jgi:hypothetical protein